jgi:hypothetical protein
MYDIFYVGSNLDNWKKLKSRFLLAKKVDSVEEAQQKSLTKMLWVVWSDISICDDFNFDYEVDDWSRDYIHTFLNGTYKDGIVLIPKKATISQREIDYRFFLNRKEVDVVASTPLSFDFFEIETFEDYKHALERSSTEMCWISSPNISVDRNFVDRFYIPWYESVDRKQNHTFLNNKFHDGIVLCSKHVPLTKREVEHRYIVNRKEWDIVASQPKPYDIVFISYQESNADENYAELCRRFPNAKRVHGIKGIHRAHIEAAKLCDTDMFWIVDGDAVLMDNFNFDYQVARWDQEIVHVWRSQNPINDLVYGYGGIKLFPKQLTIDMDTSKPDMTTSISSKFKAVHEISNVTAFNTDPFNTWKSAFRECVKLSSRIIDRQKDDETNRRLQTWCTVGADRPFGKYAIDGAKQGALYGARNQNNTEKLSMINNFEWLKEQFDVRNT